MKPNILTIGVYGFDEERFFQALLDAHVDTFCDIRRRRGMRGSLYAFANSANLQRRLNDLGIRYLHIKDLAPDAGLREQQKAAEKLARDLAIVSQDCRDRGGWDGLGGPLRVPFIPHYQM